MAVTCLTSPPRLSALTGAEPGLLVGEPGHRVPEQAAVLAQHLDEVGALARGGPVSEEESGRGAGVRGHDLRLGSNSGHMLS